MDLGNKILNDLISKDFKRAGKAAKDFIEKPDIALFDQLNKKGEFLFEFIKDKIIRNLKSAVNENNVTNLAEFTKVYSADFKEFILDGFLRFDTGNLVQNLLKNGTFTQKAYMLEFFALKKENDPLVVEIAKKNICSNCEPLKIAAISYLGSIGEKEEYNKALEILSGGGDELEKLAAVEFLACYGNKCAFDYVFEYFINSNRQTYIASNLLLLKDLKEIDENKALEIFASILRGYPDEISFEELDYCMQGGIFDILAETPDGFAQLISFYLREKLKFVLENGAYSVDLTALELKKAKLAFEKISEICRMYDFLDCIKLALSSNKPFENLIGLDIAANSEIFLQTEIKALLKASKNDEVILACVKILRAQGGFTEESAKTAFENIKNELALKEILH